MKNSKTFEVLSVFTPEEHKQFALFLEAAFFHKLSKKTKKIILLYEIFAKYFRKPNDKLIDKSNAYRIIFPNEAFIPGRIEKIMSALFKKLEIFIYTADQLEAINDFKSGIALSSFYQKKGLERLYSITIANLEKKKEKKLKKEKSDLYQNYLLQEKIASLKALFNDRKADLHIPETMKALDTFYLAARLELSCDLLAQRKFHNLLADNEMEDLTEPLLEIFNNSSTLEAPLIQIYSIVFNLLKNNEVNINDTVNSINELEALLEKYKDFIPNKQAFTLYSFNRSFLMRLINLGRKDMVPDGFKIYQDHLKNGILLIDKGIHAANFKNIISLGLMNKSYDWVADFLKTHQDKIVGTQFPSEVYKYNLANYYFHINDIAKADETLSYEFEDLYYSLAAKRLEIKIFYSKSIELLEHKTNAFKIFIHRLSKNKLPTIHRMGNTNFINLLKQIVAPTNINKDKQMRIKEKIERTEPLMEKDWLLSLIKV